MASFLHWRLRRFLWSFGNIWKLNSVFLVFSLVQAHSIQWMLRFIHSTILVSHCNDAFLSINGMHLKITSKRLPLKFHISFSVVSTLFRRIIVYLHARTTPKSKGIHFVPVIATFFIFTALLTAPVLERLVFHEKSLCWGFLKNSRAGRDWFFRKISL